MNLIDPDWIPIPTDTENSGVAERLLQTRASTLPRASKAKQHCCSLNGVPKSEKVLENPFLRDIEFISVECSWFPRDKIFREETFKYLFPLVRLNQSPRESHYAENRDDQRIKRIRSWLYKGSIFERARAPNLYHLIHHE